MIRDVLMIVNFLGSYVLKLYYKRKIYNWLKDNTMDKSGRRFKTTTEIGNAACLQNERVRQLCAEHSAIFQSEEKEDHWSIYGTKEKVCTKKEG